MVHGGSDVWQGLDSGRWGEGQENEAPSVYQHTLYTAITPSSAMGILGVYFKQTQIL